MEMKIINFKKYFPNKKIIAFLIIPSFSIIILLFLIGFLKNKKNNIFFKERKEVQKIMENELDSDGDGLKDWEEKLVGSNIFKKDSDGDGLSDNFEIKNGLDPLDPLNKKMSKIKALEKINNKKKVEYLDNKKTLTEKVAIQFLKEGLKLHKSKMISNKSAQLKMVDKIISQNQISLNFHRYKITDLKINDFITRQDFKENLLNVFRKDEKRTMIDDGYLLNKYFITKNLKYLKQIKSNIKIYKNQLHNLKKTYST